MIASRAKTLEQQPPNIRLNMTLTAMIEGIESIQRRFNHDRFVLAGKFSIACDFDSGQVDDTTGDFPIVDLFSGAHVCGDSTWQLAKFGAENVTPGAFSAGRPSTVSSLY